VSLVSNDQLKGMVHRLVPKTAPKDAPKTESERATQAKLADLAKKQLRELNAGR